MSMYNDKIVACIKVNGKILRETGDMVTLPFGSEYSILVKNLDSVRAQIGISVDGQDATDGQRLIIPPNSDMELERFIRNGNMKSGNRFKFIERSGDVEAHRGIGSDDGLIRVEAWKELVRPVLNVPITNHYYPYGGIRFNPWSYDGLHWHYNLLGGAGDGMSNSSFTVSSAGMQGAAGATCSVNNMSTTASATRPPVPKRGGGPQARAAIRGASARISLRSRPLEEQEVERGTKSDLGVTVPGSQSSQQFNMTMGFPTEATSSVVILRLRGEIGGVPAMTAVTVNAKPTCSTCGKVNKPDGQYCMRCGTALVLI